MLLLELRSDNFEEERRVLGEVVDTVRGKGLRKGRCGHSLGMLVKGKRSPLGRRMRRRKASDRGVETRGKHAEESEFVGVSGRPTYTWANVRERGGAKKGGELKGYLYQRMGNGQPESHRGGVSYTDNPLGRGECLRTAGRTQLARKRIWGGIDRFKSTLFESMRLFQTREERTEGGGRNSLTGSSIGLPERGSRETLAWGQGREEGSLTEKKRGQRGILCSGGENGRETRL